MARIEQGPFGRYVAPAVRSPQAARPVPAAFDTTGGLREIGQGLDAASDVAARRSAFERQQAEQAAAKAAREAEQATRIEETTRAKRDAVQMGEELGNQARAIVADNSIPRDQKERRLDEWVQQRRSQLEPTYKVPEVLGAQQVTIDTLAAQGREALRTDLTRRDQAQAAANVAGTLESLGRQALAAGNAEPYIQQAFDHLDAVATAAGWDALEVAKQKQNISESWTANVVAQRINQDPAGALAALKNGEYERLDPKVRVSLQEHAQSEIDRLQMKARVEADARANRAGRLIGRLGNIYEAGLQPDAHLVADATALAKGTEWEGELDAMQAAARDRSAFAVMPLAAQQAELERLRADATDPAKGVDQAGAWGIAWRERQLEALQQDIKSRGALAAAAVRGVVDVQPLDTSSPEAFAAGLADRRQAVAVASTWAGAPAGLLMPSELKAFSENLKRIPADQQSKTIEAFALAVGDPADFKAVMADLVPTNGAAASAGRLLVEHREGSREAADYLLRGESYINPPGEGAKPLLRLPNDATFAGAFDDQVGELYTGKPRVRGQALSDARRVYAALSADAGDFTQDSTSVDKKRLKQAIDIATGGLVEYNGAPVQAPRGMTEAELSDRVRARLIEANHAGAILQRITDTQLEDLQIENAPTGYYVRQGGAYLLDRRGAKLTIDPFSAPVDWQAPLAKQDPRFDVPAVNPTPTQLSTADEAKFRAWADKFTGGTTDQQLQSYDLRGAWQDIARGDLQPDERGHLPDTYKLPSHITFSQDSKYATPGAGTWKQGRGGKWTFTAGAENLQRHGARALREYFQKYEPDARLVIPPEMNLEKVKPQELVWGPRGFEFRDARQ